jgi:hypothetical protein
MAGIENNGRECSELEHSRLFYTGANAEEGNRTAECAKERRKEMKRKG